MMQQAALTHAEGYISTDRGDLHYLKWGSGHRLLIAFHGYANTAAIFKPFIPYLSGLYTILSIDLPHHGDSTWNNQLPILTADFVQLVRKAMADLQVHKVSLLGYSMGGRVCLAIVEAMPASIDRVALLASDGLTSDFYPWFFTRTRIGEALFTHMLHKPEVYLKLIEWLRRFGIIDESRYKFVMNYIKTPAGRQLLGNVWPVMSHVDPDRAILREAIKKHQVRMGLFMGKYDRIMPPSKAERFKRGLDSVALFILDKGHRVFDEQNAGEIAKWFL